MERTATHLFTCLHPPPCPFPFVCAPFAPRLGYRCVLSAGQTVALIPVPNGVVQLASVIHVSENVK